MPMAFSHTSGAPSEPSPTRACITVRYVAPALPSFTPPSPRPITDPPTLFLFFFFLNDPPPPDSSPLPLPAPLPIFRRDVFEPAPPMLKEGAYGLGATTTEVVWQIVLPYTRVGVAGGILLGLGRALGETMAVTFVIGNSHHVHASILQPGTTISAALANEFTEAVGDLYLSSLIALGLILFVITFIVLAIAKLLLIRLEKQVAR